MFQTTNQPLIDLLQIVMFHSSGYVSLLEGSPHLNKMVSENGCDWKWCISQLQTFTIIY